MVVISRRACSASNKCECICTGRKPGTTQQIAVSRKNTTRITKDNEKALTRGRTDHFSNIFSLTVTCELDRDSVPEH